MPFKLFYFGSLVITIIFVSLMVYGVHDGRLRLKKIIKRKKCRTLALSDYRKIAETPEKYEFHAPYGIEPALNLYNSEIPYIIQIIDTCIERNRRLNERFNNKEDPKILNAFLKIELQLTNMIANQGLGLTQRCKFYCNNTSKTFQLDLNRDTIIEYVKNSIRLHDQFLLLRDEEFKSNDVINISNSMFNEFLEFFSLINSTVHVHIDKNFDNKKEEETDDKHSS